MTRPLFRTLAFALALALCAAPLALSVPDAFAGQTVTIDSDVTGDVVGNSPRSDHDWDPINPLYNPADLLDASGNTVTVNSDVDGAVLGGYAESDSGSATASGNSIVINGGNVVYDVYGGGALSRDGSATASGNSVTINGGTVGGYVYGGYADSSTGSATATGNSVTINGGMVTGYVYGGYAESGSGSVTASGNSVVINGGSVDGDVYGGFAYVDSGSGSVTASGNSVVINGGSVDGDVYGGVAVNTGGSETATHNTVTISGGVEFASDTGLTGGNTDSGDAFTGNTLNVWNYSGTAVKYVEKFEFYNFTFPTTQSAAVLTVSTAALLGDGASKASVITANTLGGTSPLQPGQPNATVTLINAPSSLSGDLASTQAKGLHGATLAYNWTLAVNGTELSATLDSVQANPQAKALSEGFLGSLALTTQGADVIAGPGMANAVNAAQGAGGNGFGAFGALSGGSLRYNTGSHVDMNSVSLMTGLAWGADTTPGHLTLGAFFEYGNGTYDTHNSFSNAASVGGDGDTYYLGGGLLGRMDFAKTGPGRFYTEASARMGKTHNEFDGGDLTDGMGRSADFDSSSLYYGFHLGTGYIWNITEAASLDFYGKYFWTRQEGDSVTLSTNDPVTFKDADSSRLRGGARFAYAVNEYVAPYVGAAYEHEFDGKARATSYGHNIDAPDLTGGTGIGEIGVTFTPAASTPLSIDLGLQGYTGVREGVTGSLQMKFEF